ncbi:cell adhesion molecule 3 isoform X2 [Haplochromis burtoni]|uniref:cell adhesion molecule 3 isoform X2 n=1 Tax=Haplochromis burtoni TaxID=8153 RepID=UPI001C2DAD3B|nr:cell adhesion molecule 3 isoform X2 [Haplochromis burtoni]
MMWRPFIFSCLIACTEMPDSVSLKNLRTVEEGRQFVIQCDVVNVAPARNLSVVWHKGNKILSSQTFEESSPSPVSKSSVITLTAHRDDDGAEIWCEAKLNLWPEEQGPPPVRSEAHNVNVLYPPTFTNNPNENLEMTVGSKISLNCTAKGNPVPSYHWQFPNFTQVWYRSHDVNHPILTPSSKFPGVYICTASNSQGTATKYFIITKAPRDQTIIATIVRLLVAFGLLLFLAFLVFTTHRGIFSCKKGDYLQGQPTSSVPV